MQGRQLNFSFNCFFSLNGILSAQPKEENGHFFLGAAKKCEVFTGHRRFYFLNLGCAEGAFKMIDYPFG